MAATSGRGCAAACAAWVKRALTRLNPFHPLTTDQARLAIQCAVAIAIGCLFCVVDALWTGLLRTGVWVIVSILVVLEPNVGSTIRKSWLRVVGTVLGGFGSLAMLEIAYAAGGGQEWAEHSAAIGATITVLQSIVGAAMLVLKVQHPASAYAYLVTAFTLPIVWVPGLRSDDGEELLNALRRVGSIVIGISVACVVQVAVFPVFARRQLTEKLADALEQSVHILQAAASNALLIQSQTQTQAKAAIDSASTGAGVGGSSGGKSGAGTTGSTTGVLPGGQATAKLQREQRKVASRMDKLLEPTATELKFISGQFTAADYACLVDSVAVMGSTAVSLSAFLEAAHAPLPMDAKGTTHTDLPPELQDRVDAAAAALATAFAVLASRIRGTLEGYCLQRHHRENSSICFACFRRPPGSGLVQQPQPPAPATAANGGPQSARSGKCGSLPGEPEPGVVLSVSTALEAADFLVHELALGHEAKRGDLELPASDLCSLTTGACLALLQQARRVAAVLEAAAPAAADQAEERVKLPVGAAQSAEAERGQDKV